MANSLIQTKRRKQQSRRIRRRKPSLRKKEPGNQQQQPKSKPRNRVKFKRKRNQIRLNRLRARKQTKEIKSSRIRLNSMGKSHTSVGVIEAAMKDNVKIEEDMEEEGTMEREEDEEIEEEGIEEKEEDMEGMRIEEKDMGMEEEEVEEEEAVAVLLINGKIGKARRKEKKVKRKENIKIPNMIMMPTPDIVELVEGKGHIL